jgi:ADP-heptose:LPS heptosyltransferase
MMPLFAAPPTLTTGPSTSGAPDPTPAGASVVAGPIQRVLVLRALMLGDTLCAVPALRAMRRAWPHARISFMGLPAAREYLSRIHHVDEWLPFPGWPGLPEQRVDVRSLPSKLARVQNRAWDLAVQLHGSGQVTNPFLALTGARQMAGFHGPGAWVPPQDAARFYPWPESGHETHRLLSLCQHLGLPAEDDALEFPLRPEDDIALRQAWPGWDDCAGYACIHAGAQLPSRRWPLRRFAAVAQGVNDLGLAVVLTGTRGELPLGLALEEQLRAAGMRCVNLIGRTSLWSLGALLRRARVLVCNDTGVSHMAAALQVPSVVLSCGSDVNRWSPMDRRLHRVLAKPAPCRPCADAECPNGHACADALSVFEVLLALDDLLASTASNQESPDGPTAANSDLARAWQLPLQPHTGAA